MKAATLASLLVTSAAAGAAAAGGPFWFAYTQPFSFSASTWIQVGTGTSAIWVVDFPTTTANAVITDITTSYAGGNQRNFSVLVNGLESYRFRAQLFSSTGGAEAFGQEHHFQHGIPVPIGATVRISCNADPNEAAFNISGYFL